MFRIKIADFKLHNFLLQMVRESAMLVSQGTELLAAFQKLAVADPAYIYVM
jgi:hypothetical protein